MNLDHVRLHPRSETRVLSRGRTVMVTGRHGWIAESEPEQGFFVAQTRLLSRYEYRVDGQTPAVVALSNLRASASLGYYLLAPPWKDAPADADPTQESLEFRVTRTLAQALHEDLDFVNYTRKPVSFVFTIHLETDFLDQEAASPRKRTSTCGPDRAAVRYDWGPAGEGAWELQAEFEGLREHDSQGRPIAGTVRRGLVVRIENCDTPPAWHWSTLVFEIEMPPGGTWHACLHLVPTENGRRRDEIEECHALARHRHGQNREAFWKESTRFSAPGLPRPGDSVPAALEQARRDLDSLRLDDLDQHDRAWTVAAGLPLFAALFGRDALGASLQAVMLSRDMLRGTLPVLAHLQGSQDDPWRDERPGRMVHEVHTSPSAQLGCNPRGRYYGALTTSSTYPGAVAELWHWSGDLDEVRPLVEPALEALRFLDRDCLHDGFYYYESRSTQGIKHQSWKDSDDAIVDGDGRDVEPPLATCEEQGFVFEAKLYLAELLWWLGRTAEAERLLDEAHALQKAVDRAFWMRSEGLHCLALDRRGRQVRTVASNPGHLLASSILTPRRAARVAARLMQDDLFSGWGIRTLSRFNPAFNPYSYHRGSVWPVEQSSFSVGFYRYGFHDLLHRLARVQFEASNLFEYHRLPEVLSGHERDERHPFPALYPRTNHPQAWSATALVQHVQTLLGLYAHAPMGLLLVDPHLPEWVPTLTVEGLRVGDSVLSLRFQGTSFEILDRQGPVRVVHEPSDWRLVTRHPQERRDHLESLAPRAV